MADRPLDLIVRNVRVVRPHRPAVERLDLGVKDGRFALIAPEIPASDALEIYDARGRLGFPGVVDAHTHVGIYAPLADDAVTESRAAVSGGVTTMLTYFRTGQYYLNRGGPYAEFFPEVLLCPRDAITVTTPITWAHRRRSRGRDGGARDPSRRAVVQDLHILLTTKRGSPDGHEPGHFRGKYDPPRSGWCFQCCVEW